MDTDQAVLSVAEGIVPGVWTPRSAWWVGVTFGDGYACNASGVRRLHMTSGDEDLVIKWAQLTGRPYAVVKREGCFRAQIGCKALTEWLAQLGQDGAKGDALRWPGDLPAEFNGHFLRGLWDTDGSIMRTKRPDGRTDLLRCVFCNKSVELVAAMVAHFPALRQEEQRVSKGRYQGRTYALASVRGRAAVDFVRGLYLAPDVGDLCCARKQDTARQYVAWYDANRRGCARCGREVCARELCKHCVRVKTGGACSECAKAPVYARGKCQTCYYRGWQAQRDTWNNEKVLAKLETFPVKEWGGLDPVEQDRQVEEILRLYAGKGLPWFVLSAGRDVDGAEVLDQVRRAKVTVDDRDHVIRAVSSAGQRVCTAFHPHRLKASYRGLESAAKAFENEALLRKALLLQLRHGQPVTPKRVLRAICVLVKNPTNFAPALARVLVDRYGTASGTVLDPCSGYGGRMLGALASEHRVNYIGYDVEPRTVAANNKLAQHVGAGDRATCRVQAVEDDDSWPAADLVLTCPPYFDRERYGTEADERLRPYGDFAAWTLGFLAPLVRKARCAPWLVLCVSDFRRDSKRLELVAETRQLLLSEGWCVEETWLWKTATFGKSRRSETILVAMRGDSRRLPDTGHRPM